MYHLTKDVDQNCVDQNAAILENYYWEYVRRRRNKFTGIVIASSNHRDTLLCCEPFSRMRNLEFFETVPFRPFSFRSPGATDARWDWAGVIVACPLIIYYFSKSNSCHLLQLVINKL